MKACRLNAIQHEPSMTERRTTTPDRVFLIGGVKRTGTSLMRNLIGSHTQVAIPPVEFGFFTDYDPAEFGTPEAYARALAHFRAGSRPERWSLGDIAIAEDGASARDFYCAVLDAFRRQNKPTAQYFGDKSTFIESRFETYLEWFGAERIRFVHMVRNPFDCYASTKSIPHLRHWPSYAIHHFCEEWSRSMLLGLSLSQRYPASYRMVRYEDLVADPGPIVSDLCRWMDVPDETDRMLAGADYERKSNSSFGDIPERSHDGENSVVNLPAGGRLKHLDDREIITIQSMTVGQILPLLHYDILGGGRDTAPEVQLSCAVHQYLNLCGVRSVVPAFFRQIATASRTIVTMIVERARSA